MTQRVQVRLERAEAETLLERRKKAAEAASDQARKEIGQIEDRLAVLNARGKVLDEETEKVRKRMIRAETDTLDLEGLKDDIAQMEASSRKVAAEIEALSVELNAPPRMRRIDDAALPGK
jgi:chromosome segregation ATPase